MILPKLVRSHAYNILHHFATKFFPSGQFMRLLGDVFSIYQDIAHQMCHDLISLTWLSSFGFIDVYVLILMPNRDLITMYFLFPLPLIPWLSLPYYIVMSQGALVGWLVDVGLPLGTFSGIVLLIHILPHHMLCSSIHLPIFYLSICDLGTYICSH